jgi:hypothetical protein
MLLSRIWFLFLALAAIMGLSTALLARGMINREHLSVADEQLRRDRFEIESLLKLDARARLDTLAPIAADGTVREAVRSKGRDKVDGQEGSKALRDRLRTMNQQLEELRADLLIAVDADGTIVAQEGRKPARAGAGLGKMPLVERALGGYLGDDVWVYDGGVYRMAARPIVDRGQYVGAIIHGQRLDAVLAQRLSERLGGSTVAFFFGPDVIASYTPTDVAGAPTQSEIAPLLPNVLNDEKLNKGERTEPFDLGGRARTMFSLVAGSASAAQVGYAVARPYSTIASPWAIFNEATKEDIAALPKVALGLGFLLMFALAMGIMYLERDRPLALFQREVDKIAQGQSEELDLSVLSTSHRRIGEGLHKAIDTLLDKGGGKRRQQKANLDEILGPAPESLTSAAFSFGGNERATPQPLAPVAMPTPMAMPAPVAMAAPGGANASAPPLRVPPPAPKPPPPKMPPPAAPAGPRGLSSVSSSFRTEDKSVMLKLDGSSGELDEEATVIAEVPDQLRQQSRDDDGHFREVFEQYLALRQQCGESISELSFDKFTVTLRKNRDTIMLQRPETKDVRFTVYVKAGKAALKATPVKA